MTYFTNTKAQVSVDVPRGVILQMFEWLETIETKKHINFSFSPHLSSRKTKDFRQLSTTLLPRT